MHTAHANWLHTTIAVQHIHSSINQLSQVTICAGDLEFTEMSRTHRLLQLALLPLPPGRAFARTNDDPERVFWTLSVD